MTNSKRASTSVIRPVLFPSLILAGSLFLSACTTMLAPNGGLVTREMDFSDFDSVEVADAFSVEIKQGDEYQVVITVDETSASYLDVKQRGDTVEIGLLPRSFFFFFLWNLNFHPVLRAEITMPELLEIGVHDASEVNVSGFSSGEEVRVEVTDASSLSGELASGDARISAADASELTLEGDRQDVEIEANDASKVTLQGEGQNVSIDASDASTVDLTDFAVQDATIKASDASKVTVDATGTLEIEAQDASSVVYYGDPTLGSTESRDGSSIEARQR